MTNNNSETSRSPLDQLPLDQLPLDQLPLDQLPLDQLPLDQLPLDNLPVIHISSVTGNTRKLADVVCRELNDPSVSLHIPEDLVILFFWCRRGSMDDHTLHRLAEYQDRPILAFGTLGHVPHDTYGRRVYDTVTQLINEHNTCLGVYLCQGKIDERRTEKRRALSPDQPHYLDDEGYARHLASRSHPDTDDLTGAVHFLHRILN